jgi:hypothetical protein
MAELEIHTEAEGGDPFGKKIGVLTAVLAVLLGIVTIVSHRAHTAAVIFKADANDKWSLYQAKRIKFHNLELGTDLLTAIGPKTDETGKMLSHYASEMKRYAHDSDTTQEDAVKTGEKVEHIEAQALRYDFGEGLLEIGLVLSSLYFIARSKLFPVVGVTSAVIGVGLAISGYLL